MKIVNTTPKTYGPDPDWWKSLQAERGFRTSLYHARELLANWRKRRLAA
jgi:hypothetical protein